MLALDLDGQGDLTTGVGIDDEIFADSDANIYSLLTESRGDVRRMVRPAPNDRFDVVPGNIQMFRKRETLAVVGLLNLQLSAQQQLSRQSDKALFTVHNRERRLERIFETISGVYDFILIDCPPNLGTVTNNALLACRHVLVPARMNKKIYPRHHHFAGPDRDIGRIWSCPVLVDCVFV